MKFLAVIISDMLDNKHSIHEYIKEHLRHGYPINQLQDHFRNHGWSEEHIHESFKPFENDNRASKEITAFKPQNLYMLAIFSTLVVALLKIIFGSSFFVYRFGIFDSLLLELFILPLLFITLAPLLVFGILRLFNMTWVQKRNIIIAHLLFLIPGILMHFVKDTVFLIVSLLFFFVIYTLLLKFSVKLKKTYLIITVIVTTVVFGGISALLSHNNAQQIISPEPISPTPTQDKRLPLGSTAEVDGVKVTILKTEFSPTLGNEKAYVGIFVITTLRIENSTDKPFRLSNIGSASQQGTYSEAGGIYPMPGQPFQPDVAAGSTIETTLGIDAPTRADAITVNDAVSAEKGIGKIRVGFKIK